MVVFMSAADAEYKLADAFTEHVGMRLWMQNARRYAQQCADASVCIPGRVGGNILVRTSVLHCCAYSRSLLLSPANGGMEGESS